MTSAAQIAVLSTPDLLVLILSQLPHSSLLKAKLVNRTWASLFRHVEIQAALFERPRPKGSALYTETYSDVLMDRFSAFWPTDEESDPGIQKNDVEEKLRAKESSEETPTLQPRPHGHIDKCPNWQWRQLLVCQPAVEVLEIVHFLSRRGNNPLEFRTIIPRPKGLRMGFLYDAVRHWYKVEGSFGVQLRWNRKTGDPMSFDPDEGDASYKTAEGKPCVTLSGWTSVGCGQYGGLTYANYRGGIVRSSDQVIKSGDEEVEYSMSEIKTRDVDAELSYADEDVHGYMQKVLQEM